MASNPNEKRIWVRFKDPGNVELIEIAAYQNRQSRQEWMRSVLVNAAISRPADSYLDTVVQRSSLIIQKTLERLFPDETGEAKKVVEDFLTKLKDDDE